MKLILSRAVRWALLLPAATASFAATFLVLVAAIRLLVAHCPEGSSLSISTTAEDMAPINSSTCTAPGQSEVQFYLEIAFLGVAPIVVGLVCGLVAPAHKKIVAICATIIVVVAELLYWR